MSWQHGAVLLPLTAATTRPLLEDADPALYHAGAFFAAMLERDLGARLKNEFARHGLAPPMAVAERLSAEITPALLANRFRFPLLALYRKGEQHNEITLSYDRSVAEWEMHYALPPLSPLQIGELTPILRLVARIIARYAALGRDPDYLGGADVWATAGITRARLVSASFDNWDEVPELNGPYRFVRLKIEVTERDQPYTADADPFDGVDLAEDIEAPTGATLSDVVVGATYSAPTLASIEPASGPMAGGTTVIVTGTGFRTGTPVALSIGGLPCDDVAVLSPTEVQGVTPAHDAQPSFAADVVFTAFDGQSATLESAYAYTSA